MGWDALKSLKSIGNFCALPFVSISKACVKWRTHMIAKLNSPLDPKPKKVTEVAVRMNSSNPTPKQGIVATKNTPPGNSLQATLNMQPAYGEIAIVVTKEKAGATVKDFSPSKQEKAAKAPEFKDFKEVFLTKMDPRILQAMKKNKGGKTSKEVMQIIEETYKTSNKNQLSPQKLRENIESALKIYLDADKGTRQGTVDFTRKVLNELFGAPDAAPIQSTFSEAKKIEYKEKILKNFNNYVEIWSAESKQHHTGGGSGSSITVLLDTKTGLFSKKALGAEGKPLIIAAGGRALLLQEYNNLHGSVADIGFLEKYPNGSNNHPVVENDDAAIVLGACEMLLQEIILEEKKLEGKISTTYNFENLINVDKQKIEDKLNKVLDTYSLKIKSKPEECISVKRATKTDKAEEVYNPVILKDDKGNTRLLASIGTAFTQKAKWIVASEALTSEKNNFLPFVQVRNDGKMHFIIPYDLKKAGFLDAVREAFPNLLTEDTSEDFIIEQKKVKEFMKRELGFDDSFIEDLTSVYTSIETPIEITSRGRDRGSLETHLDTNVFKPTGDRT